MSFSRLPQRARQQSPASRLPAPNRPSPGAPGNQARLRRLQAKLAIGPVDDPLEHEADAVADKVMRMPDTAAPPRISLTSAVGDARDATLQPKAAENTMDGGSAPASVDATLQTPGQPLAAGLRDFFEPRFGADFSAVRVHDGGEAGRSAQEIGARAYTAGPDLVFAPGAYAPGEPAGRRLIAHELTHVVQQSEGTGAAIQRQTPDPAPAPAPPPGAAAPAPGDPQTSPGVLDLAPADDLSAKNTKLAEFVAGFQKVLAASPKAMVVATAFWSSKASNEAQGGPPDDLRKAAASRASNVKAALVALGVPDAAISAGQTDLNEATTAQGPDGMVRLTVLQTPEAVPASPPINPATVAPPAQPAGAPLFDLDKDADPSTANLKLGELAKFQLAQKLKDPGGTVKVIGFAEDPAAVPVPGPGGGKAPPPDPAVATNTGEDRAKKVRDTLVAGGVDAAVIYAEGRFAPHGDARIGHVWVQFVPKAPKTASGSPLDFSKFTTVQIQTANFAFAMKVPSSIEIKSKFVEGKISTSPGASLKLKPIPGLPGLEVGLSGEITSLSSLTGSSTPPAAGAPAATPPVKFSLSVGVNGQGFKIEASTEVNLDNTNAALDNTPSALDKTPSADHRGKVTSGIYVTLVEPQVKYQIPSSVLNDLNSNGVKLQQAINSLMNTPNQPEATQPVGGPPAPAPGPQTVAGAVVNVATAIAGIADAMDKIDKAKKQKVAPKLRIGAGVADPIGPPGPGGSTSDKPIPFAGVSGTF